MKIIVARVAWWVARVLEFRGEFLTRFHREKKIAAAWYVRVWTVFTTKSVPDRVTWEASRKISLGIWHLDEAIIYIFTHRVVWKRVSSRKKFISLFENVFDTLTIDGCFKIVTFFWDQAAMPDDDAAQWSQRSKYWDTHAMFTEKSFPIYAL